ncbi:ankyrin repeat domain-containing protein [bacterium]|nr:ankyrin repeat domain-containing protein [bacterium]
MKKILVVFCLLTLSAFASEVGNFSENSVIMKELYGSNTINDAKLEKLKAKNLDLSAQCLVEQVKKGSLENVNLLLQNGIDPNKGYVGEYALYYAAKSDNLIMTKLLIAHGAKPDKGFYSELFEAVKNKNTQMAKLLLKNGANVNYKDAITNRTILYYSLKNNMHDLSKELIKSGAKADMYSYRYIQKHKLQYLIPQTN